MKYIKSYEEFERLNKALHGDGVFLVVKDKKGKLNVMTIGWAMVGVVWGKPMMTVFVRPARYTHELIENAESFSVCVPLAGKMKEELAFCGTSSGKMVDKIKQCDLSLVQGKHKDNVLIDDCKLFYECEIVEKCKIAPSTLSKEIKDEFYVKDDFHSIYFGEIKHCYIRD